MADALESLSAADWLRLRKVARHYAIAGVLRPDDLLQEAFKRALEGRRNCPPDVSVVKCLAEAMRSIADGEREKAMAQPKIRPVHNHGDQQTAVDPPDCAPDAESRLASDEAIADIENRLSATFADDVVAQTMVDGIIDGMERPELMDLTGLDETQYESKRRQIRRRLEKEFGEGGRK